MAAGMTTFNMWRYAKSPGRAVTLLLLVSPLLVLLCMSEIKVPAKASSVRSLQASSVPGSLATQAESTVRSADQVDEIADSWARLFPSRARPRDQLVENHHRNLLTAPQDQQNCTCACTMTSNKQVSSFSMSCNASDSATAVATTCIVGACGGEAVAGAVGGFVGAILPTLFICGEEGDLGSFVPVLILGGGLSAALGVGVGCLKQWASTKHNSGCFPGDATVFMANGGVKPMAALALGEKVAVRKHDGSVAFEDVYAFGHRDAVATARFVRLTLRPIEADSLSDPTVESRTLELTELHFTTILSGNAPINKRAKDVVEGDIMWAQGRASRRLDGHEDPTMAFAAYVVTNILHIPKQGLYNPFTLGGTIIVNGVVASTHSDWFLDSTFELFNAVHWLPAAYQVLLLPFRMLYYGLGKDAYIKLYDRLDTLLDIPELLSGRKHGAIIRVCNIAVAITGAQLLVAMLRRTSTLLHPAERSTY